MSQICSVLQCSLTYYLSHFSLFLFLWFSLSYCCLYNGIQFFQYTKFVVLFFVNVFICIMWIFAVGIILSVCIYSWIPIMSSWYILVLHHFDTLMILMVSSCVLIIHYLLNWTEKSDCFVYMRNCLLAIIPFSFHIWILVVHVFESLCSFG